MFPVKCVCLSKFAMARISQLNSCRVLSYSNFSQCRRFIRPPLLDDRCATVHPTTPGSRYYARPGLADSMRTADAYRFRGSTRLGDLGSEMLYRMLAPCDEMLRHPVPRVS